MRYDIETQSDELVIFCLCPPPADLMGSTITNLEHLLRMPYGCGEQNMLNFAPNIYVMDYLSATGQLTTALSERAVTNMEAGQCALNAITGADVTHCRLSLHVPCAY